MKKEYQLDKTDVQLIPLKIPCDDCESKTATVVVVVDFRSAGATHELGRYCLKCGKRHQLRIRDGLPRAKNH